MFHAAKRPQSVISVITWRLNGRGLGVGHASGAGLHRLRRRNERDSFLVIARLVFGIVWYAVKTLARILPLCFFLLPVSAFPQGRVNVSLVGSHSYRLLFIPK